MTRRWRAFSWGLAALCSAMTLAAIWIGISDGRLGTDLLTGGAGSQAVIAVTLPVLGALLVSNGHRLGWVFSMTGATRAVTVFASQWALHDYRSGGSLPFPDTMALVSLITVLPGPGLGALSVLLFPDGALPDERRRWKAGLLAVVVSATGIVLLLPAAWSAPGPSLVDDSPAPSALASIGLAVTIGGALVGIAIGLAGLVTRLRGPDAERRQQTKWYLLGALAAVVLNLSGDVLPQAGYLNLLGTFALEAAILVAVRRYALWQVDLLVQRTVVYGLLSALLVAVYAGVVLGLGLILEALAHGRSIAVAAGALAAASLAGPTHRALQQRVDQRFDRRTYDAVRQVRELSTAAPELLESALRAQLRDPTLALSFRTGTGPLVDPLGGTTPPPTRGTAWPGGWISHRELGPEERRRATRVFEAAADGLAFGRLHAELRVQLALVEQSRKRVIEAADNERRRVERDLHDGAQQRLVALAMTLRSEQRKHGLSPEAVRIIDLGVREITASVHDLRVLASGILPGSLVSEGLSTAVRELAARQPQAVTCTLAVSHRHLPQLEATGWFVVAEGLANCLKHAPEAAVTVEVSCDGEALRISVEDDGPGGATWGSGLTGLQDRVGAGSGQLVLSSGASRGTSLMAVLPCAS